MGADRAVLIETKTDLEPLGIAKVLCCLQWFFFVYRVLHAFVAAGVHRNAGPKDRG